LPISIKPNGKDYNSQEREYLLDIPQLKAACLPKAFDFDFDLFCLCIII
jgi:hypothetical protein